MLRFSMVGAALILAIAATANAEAKTMKVFNPTHYAVTAVQAKQPGAKEWDKDLLGKTALGIGKVAAIELTTPVQDCKVDLRITFDDGHQVEKHNVDVCASDVLQFDDN